MFSLSMTINKTTGTDLNLQKNVLSHRLFYVLIRLSSFRNKKNSEHANYIRVEQKTDVIQMRDW